MAVEVGVLAGATGAIVDDAVGTVLAQKLHFLHLHHWHSLVAFSARHEVPQAACKKSPFAA